MALRERLLGAAGVVALVACGSFGSSADSPGPIDAGTGTTEAGADAADAFDGAGGADAGGDAGGTCAHSYCQEFDGPIATPWSLENDIGTAEIDGGELFASIPGGASGLGARLELNLDPPAAHLRCAVALRLGGNPTNGSVWVLTLNAETPNTYVGVSVAGGVKVKVGDTMGNVTGEERATPSRRTRRSRSRSRLAKA